MILATVSGVVVFAALVLAIVAFLLMCGLLDRPQATSPSQGVVVPVVAPAAPGSVVVGSGAVVGSDRPTV